MSRFDRPRDCRVEGCEKRNDISGFCNSHYVIFWQHKNGERGNGKNSPGSITPEVIAEFRRRIARFEKPGTVARDLGFSLSGLRKAAERAKGDAA